VTSDEKKNVVVARIHRAVVSNSASYSDSMKNNLRERFRRSRHVANPPPRTTRNAPSCSVTSAMFDSLEITRRFALRDDESIVRASQFGRFAKSSNASGSSRFRKRDPRTHAVFILQENDPSSERNLDPE